MSTPNYVFKFEEIVHKEMYEAPLKRVLRLSSPVLFLLYAVRHFTNNGFSFLSIIISGIGLLFFLFWAWVGNPTRNETVPCEIRFYDDHLERYVERLYMSKRDTREEFYSVKYSAITDCYYSKSYPKFDIMGDMYYKIHRYNAQGQLEDKAFREGFMKDTGFWMQLPEDTVTADFVNEIETHAPIKVKVL